MNFEIERLHWRLWYSSRDNEAGRAADGSCWQRLSEDVTNAADSQPTWYVHQRDFSTFVDVPVRAEVMTFIMAKLTSAICEMNLLTIG